MYIHEAVAEAVKINGFMTRRSFNGCVFVRPTDTPDRCILYSCLKGQAPGPRWQPGAGDLLADDWIAVTEIVTKGEST